MNEVLVRNNIINMKDAYYLKKYVEILKKQNKNVECNVSSDDEFTTLEWNYEFVIGMIVDYVLRKEVVFKD
ncbi:MAG: hypothetical protein JRI52_10280 [Deltaproteobacteria bacterium]|nr:hypothetical protein [Deltaproteobacteria bacterium]